MAIRFVRSSEVIKKLKDFREYLGFSESDFAIFGSGDFLKAESADHFVKDGANALYVMTGNSSSSVTTLTGSGVEELVHNIDVAFFTRLSDTRGQKADEVSVWFKEFLIRALYGWEAFEGCEPIQFNGDSFNNIQGAAIYSRVYQFTQNLYLDQTDKETDGKYGDLDDFALLYTDLDAVAPDFDEIAETDFETNIPTA